MISIKKTSDQDVELKQVKRVFAKSTYVDMHCKGKSTSKPLFSDNYANCLGVIVHDEENHRGYLMHIFPALAGGINVHTLFHFVDEQIEEALAEFSGSRHIQLMLFKGLSYTPAGLKALTRTYADYAKIKFGDRVECVLDIMDNSQVTRESKLLYHPQTGEAYIIDSGHDSLFNSQSLKSVSDMSLETWSMEQADELAEFDQSVASSLEKMADILGEHKIQDEVDDDRLTTTTSHVISSLYRFQYDSSEDENAFSASEDDFTEFVGYEAILDAAEESENSEDEKLFDKKHKHRSFLSIPKQKPAEEDTQEESKQAVKAPVKSKQNK